MARRWVGLAALLALACTKEPNAETGDRTDRTIARLKAEQERLRHAPAPQKDEAPLATAAISGTEAVALQVRTGLTQVGTVGVHVDGAQTMRSVAGPRTSVATGDRFVKVDLTLTATEGTHFEVALAVLAQGAERFAIARDAQHLGAPGPLAFDLVAGEPRRVSLYFEAPLEALGPGLKLELPRESGSVQVPLREDSAEKGR